LCAHPHYTPKSMGAAAIIAGAVIAGGAAAYGAHEQSKSAKALAGNQRDPNEEINALMGFAPDALNTGMQYDYLAGKQQLGLMNDFFTQATERYPELSRREREATTEQRQWDLRDLRNTGTQMQTAIEGLAPELRGAGNALQRMLGETGDTSPLLRHLNDQAIGEDLSPINSRLQDYAMQQLDLGDRLAPDEQRRITQDTRAAYSDRGLFGGDASVVDEILGLDSARRNRAAQRVGVASGINSGILGELNQDHSFGMGVEDLNQRDIAGDRAFIPAAVNAGNARLAAMLGLFDHRAAVSPTAGAAIMGQTPNLAGTSARTIADILGYGRDAYDTNFNAREARGIAQGNNGAAIAGAGIQAGSQLSATGVKIRADQSRG
jgi:hypothetical protein